MTANAPASCSASARNAESSVASNADFACPTPLAADASGDDIVIQAG